MHSLHAKKSKMSSKVLKTCLNEITNLVCITETINAKAMLLIFNY